VNGERYVAQELESLKQNIGTMEMQLRKNLLYVQGQLEMSKSEQQLTQNHAQKLHHRIADQAEKVEQLYEKLRQREIKRKKHIRNGLLRALPATVQVAALRGHAPFPPFAYDPAKDVAIVSLPEKGGLFLDGRLLVLEDSLQPVEDLRAENLYVSIIDVQAIEAKTAFPSSSGVSHGLGVTTTVDSVAAADVANNQLNGPAWVAKAQTIAMDYLEKHRVKSLFPSQRDTGEHVAKILRAQNVFSENGKPLSASYIRRNALQGPWWKVNSG
jgi:hypothetical protein